MVCFCRMFYARSAHGCLSLSISFDACFITNSVSFIISFRKFVVQTDEDKLGAALLLDI